MKHGAGATIEAAHDQAALMALHSLADLGMEAVADGKKDTNTNLNSGDGYVTFIILYPEPNQPIRFSFFFAYLLFVTFVKNVILYVTMLTCMICFFAQNHFLAYVCIFSFSHT